MRIVKVRGRQYRMAAYEEDTSSKEATQKKKSFRQQQEDDDEPSCMQSNAYEVFAFRSRLEASSPDTQWLDDDPFSAALGRKLRHR